MENVKKLLKNILNHYVDFDYVKVAKEGLKEIEALESRSCDNCLHKSRPEYKEPCSNCMWVNEFDNWEA